MVTATDSQDERRTRARAQLEHIVVGSIGIEYFASWTWLAWGLILPFIQLPPTANPLISFIQMHNVLAGALLALVGSAHFGALLYWPHTDMRTIAIRKAASALEFTFWLAQWVINLTIMFRAPTLQPSGLLSTFSAIPIVVLLFIAVCRRIYRDW
jgi:hypothetical protein